MIWLSLVIVLLLIIVAMLLFTVFAMSHYLERVRREIKHVEDIVLKNDRWVVQEPMALVERLQTIIFKLRMTNP